MESAQVSIIDEWLKQQWVIYTMEYWWAVKKKKTLSFAIVWVDPENIMLSEINQSKRKIPDDFTHMWNLMNKWN